MSQIVSGVYKITNEKTNQFYIGCSTNIARRWSAHRTRYKEKTNREYNKPLYQAMRDYGIEHFKFEIIEEVTNLENLFSEEYRIIQESKACEKGYNEPYGGENHGRAKLTAADVVDIRERYAALESKRNVFLDYCNKIGERGFNKVWNGYTWPDIMMDVYTPENKRFHKFDTGSKGEDNSRTKLTNQEVISIRKRKANGERPADVYKEFDDRMTYGSFKNMWYGRNWKNIA